MRLLVLVPLTLVLGLVSVACGESEDSATTSTSSTTTSESVAPTTTSEGTAASSEGVIWPQPGGDVRYSDPVEAASGFATELVGFTAPVLGGFREGDSRSGEVEIRSSEDGPTTVVFVRQVQGDDWSVIGAATADIALDSPEVLDAIASPVALAGRATAFEGTVQTAVTDADGERLGEGFVTGGALGELEPFEGELPFDTPMGDHGAVLAYTVSARDGTVEEATVVAVRFADDG